MDKSSTDQLIERACKGNQAAAGFLGLYLKLAHAIDDCVDEEPNKERLLQTFLLLISFCSLNPFYLEYRAQLYPLLALSLSRYATSVEWEGSKVSHEKHMADHLRSDGAAVIEYVALLCGGIEHMRLMSPLIWTDSWKCHHNSEGQPV